jgi:hypothetical protein
VAPRRVVSRDMPFLAAEHAEGVESAIKLEVATPATLEALPTADGGLPLPRLAFALRLRRQIRPYRLSLRLPLRRIGAPRATINPGTTGTLALGMAPRLCIRLLLPLLLLEPPRGRRSPVVPLLGLGETLLVPRLLIALVPSVPMVPLLLLPTATVLAPAILDIAIQLIYMYGYYWATASLLELSTSVAKSVRVDAILHLLVNILSPKVRLDHTCSTRSFKLIELEGNGDGQNIYASVFSCHNEYRYHWLFNLTTTKYVTQLLL